MIQSQTSDTRINDRKLLLPGILLMALVISVCFNLFYTLEFGIPFWKVLLSNGVYVSVCVLLARQVVMLANRIYPEKTGRRVAFLLFVLIALAPLIGAGHIWFEKNVLFRDNEPQSLYSYLSASGSTFFFTLIITSVYEAWAFFLKWNKATREKEAFEKASIEAQYQLLKSQVQPHFLFNSLNTLISLVDEDSRRAKKFIRELAHVYRYLLQSNEHRLIPLKEELAFVQSYLYLLQTRFEEGLRVELDLADAALKQLLPPLTLQVLVENAVKHNRADREHPLTIRIAASESKLKVCNNLKRKAEPLFSTRIGLSNILAKYTSLKQQDVLVEETETAFCVTLPLLSPETNTTTNRQIKNA